MGSLITLESIGSTIGLHPHSKNGTFIGYSDGSSIIIWIDNEIIQASNSGFCIPGDNWTKVHPRIANDLRELAYEQRNGGRLLEAL